MKTNPNSLGVGLGIIIATGLAACSSVPSSGPSTSEVLDSARTNSDSVAMLQNQGISYLITDINPHVVAALKNQLTPSLRAAFGDGTSDVQGTLRPGDRVTLTIWESGPGALFSPSASTVSSVPTMAQTSVIPEQTIAPDGTILVPYAGRVKVAGMTGPEAQMRIEEKLHGRTSQPQVLLTVSLSMSDVVTIAGDNAKGGLVPLATAGSDRILDVIAQTGGITSPVYAATVQLIRSGKSATVPLQNVILNPDENIRVHPGDTLVISRNPEYFTALGATGKSAQVPFEAADVSLTEALGKAGGLLDERADPSGVFVFRYETRDTALRLCPSCEFVPDQVQVPVVYRLDAREPRNLFSAQSFAMTNRDLLYVSNAPPVPLQKVLGIIRDFLSPVLTGAVVDRAVNK
ncbi:MAG TPA: polysaccharide biosynthesis/export family protein [Nevskiaceae bacterium]|nr:polysaccharide biosynthesis/export family protein [Nevskiaceae bacterium]